MNYGTLSKLSGGPVVEGYYTRPPLPGQGFLFHGNPEVGDVLTPRVDAVYQVPKGIRPALPTLGQIQFPKQAHPGDLFFITSEGPYLLQVYRPGWSGDAA